MRQAVPGRNIAHFAGLHPGGRCGYLVKPRSQHRQPDGTGTAPLSPQVCLVRTALNRAGSCRDLGVPFEGVARRRLPDVTTSSKPSLFPETAASLCPWGASDKVGTELRQWRAGDGG